MEEKVLEIIKKYNLIENKDKIVIGVSGGPDSITLLDILLKIKKENLINFDIVVCHVNHMIRKEAIDDELYVSDFCKKNKIDCYIKRIDVVKYANNKKVGTEEAGRIVRYKFFDEIMKKIFAKDSYYRNKYIFDFIDKIKIPKKVGQCILISFKDDEEFKEVRIVNQE